MAGYAEVAEGVFVLRYPVLDVNSSLVLGSEVAVVVDTLSTDAQARELLAAVRGVTRLPLVLVNTHHHFDHSFGNGVLVSAGGGGGIWAHEEALAELRDSGERWQREWYQEWRESEPELADGLLRVAIVPPDRPVQAESTMDIGGRTLELRHLGRGHTAGDLTVLVPDANLLLAGDLVEESGPPSFGDSYPVDWPDTLAGLLELTTASTRVVPGHGAVVDQDFVRAQHEELTALAWLIREGHADAAPAEAVAAKASYPLDVALTAVRRGYLELSGRS